MRIVTDYLYPGWRAYDADSYDGATDSPDPITGYGKTEALAIVDLYERIEFEQEERDTPPAHQPALVPLVGAETTGDLPASEGAAPTSSTPNKGQR